MVQRQPKDLSPENEDESQKLMKSYRWLENNNFDGDNDDGEEGDGDHGDKDAHVVQENLSGENYGDGGVKKRTTIAIEESGRG